MKPNELMIDDWVEYGQYITTVRSLSDKIILSGCIGRLDEVRPVPITTEILEANDFEEQPDVPEGCFNYVYNNGGQIVYVSPLPWDSFSIDANFHGRLSMSIQYVHELQHILRLIGINDLADNFKIEKGGNQ